MQQSACLVIKPFTMDNFAALFLKLHAGGSGVRLYDGPDLKLIILFGWDWSSSSVAWSTGAQIFSGVVWQSRDLQLPRNMLYLFNPRSIKT